MALCPSENRAPRFISFIGNHITRKASALYKGMETFVIL